MSDLAIRVDRLGKQYRIGRPRERYKTLRETVSNQVREIVQGYGPRIGREGQRQPATDLIWALKDVSVDIRRGEVLGIIGRNGAGKSTLLKILSRVTKPTTGYAAIWGRVGSLLEVGTGFHPELTGRENIYLNGAILGMRRSEINRKFHEIVTFAGVEQFIDTPVKRYSSGMHVRLAFAVAAHLEPEVLVVDEVLAVGDAEFQRKCLGKMGDVASQGRTVIFVSHNMAAIQTLCTRAILLDKGTIVADADVTTATSEYLRTLEQRALTDIVERTDRHGRGHVLLKRVELYDGHQGTMPTSMLVTGHPVQFVFHVTERRSRMTCTFTIYDQYGLAVTNFSSVVHSPEDRREEGDDPKFICEIGELPLVPGWYRINVAITVDGELEDHLEAAVTFDVQPGQLRGRPVAQRNQYGSVAIPHRWVTLL
jgi:lipopolysaccharide transport system ATP-binding protein